MPNDDYDKMKFLEAMDKLKKKRQLESQDAAIEKMREPQKRPAQRSELFEAADSEAKTKIKDIPESEQINKGRYNTPTEITSGEDFKNKQFETEIESAKRRRIKADALGDVNMKKASQLELAGLAKKADSEGLVDVFRRVVKGGSKVGKAMVGAVPILGGLAAAMATGDASAAVPILGDADTLGPAKGSADSVIENPNSTPEERKRAFEELRRRLQP